MRDPVLDVDVMTLRGIIAAAEERGRRRGVEERDAEWRSAWDTAFEGGCVLWSCDCDEPKEEGNCERWRKLLVIAPRDSGKVESRDFRDEKGFRK